MTAGENLIPRIKTISTGILVLLLLSFSCGPLRAKAVKNRSYSDVSPKTTTSLNQLAVKYGFRSITVSGKQITMLTRFNTLSMEGGSRRATFNGTTIWLNGPIARHWGSWHITQADIDRTVWPLLNQDKALAAEKYQIVVLDPGHGGDDKGAQSRTGMSEKAITLELARKVRSILLRYRIDARLTRNSDKKLELEDRTDRANRWKSSLFVSIHLNAADNSAPAGIETHILPPVNYPSTANSKAGIYDRAVYPGNRHDRANMVLGYLLQRSLLKYAGGEDRGVRRSRFVVLKNISCPAALLECGFLSNRSEGSKLTKPDHLDKVARAIAEGIISYLNSVKRANQANP
ncbi:MAG: N-acetylmuramoyl-L-alanine amidase [Kiritimatiellia bacterium]|nr:N-acetylmuramoyl-L-alanine amidase [Kiritimatiellia bacterium]